MSHTRPNILFAIADDASHMSAYGHQFLDTPAFDRVAREGVIFTQAFTTNPKCAPSRASILTGRHTWQLEEACDHWNVWPDKFVTYPDVLEEAGYHVGFTGKGWDPGDWKRTSRTKNPAGRRYEGRTLSPPNGCISKKDYAANFSDFLDASPNGSPFCFWYGGHEPHRPYHLGEGSEAGKDPNAIRVPSYFPDRPDVRSDLADYAHEVEWFDQHLSLMLDELERRGLLDNTLVIVTSDNGMPFPRVKGNMYDDDFRLPMAMMWHRGASNRGTSRTPDGSAASGGVVLDDMISFTDIAPTFLEAAGLTIHPQMSGRSFLRLLDAKESGRFDPTRDRVCMGRERHDLGREGDRGYPVRCIRTDQYLYVRNFCPDRWPAGNPETGFTGCDSSPTKDAVLSLHESGESSFFQLAFGKRPEEELYDVTNDPECIENLAARDEFADIARQLWCELKSYLLAQSDPRILGNGEVFDSYEYVGDAEHSWRAYEEGRWNPQPY